MILRTRILKMEKQNKTNDKNGKTKQNKTNKQTNKAKQNKQKTNAKKKEKKGNTQTCETYTRTIGTRVLGETIANVTLTAEHCKLI